MAAVASGMGFRDLELAGLKGSDSARSACSFTQNTFVANCEQELSAK